MTNITVSTQVTHETTTTEVIELSADVQVHRVTVTRIPEGKNPSSSVFESVVYKGVPEDENFGTFKVVDPALLPKLKMSGWFEGSEDYDMLVQTPFTKVLSGEPYEVIRIKDYDHSIYNTEGEHLPVARHFNYMDGGVNDYNFDLERLLTHLQSRSDVTLVQERFQNSFIGRVPHYNAGGSSGHRCISFIWHPDVEVYREYRRLSTSKCFTRLNVAHTLMGNDQFRVNSVEDE
jgi:hypothetical protein